MRTTIAFLLALAAAPVLASGEVDTAERGIYSCELPGDAAGAAGVRQADKDFRIRSASRYKSDAGDGVYLRQGNTIRFTTGPRGGESWQIVSPNLIRQLGPDGKPGRLRCIRTGR